MEERRLATWGTEVPEDLVLDEKLLAEALRKVNKNPAILNHLGNYLVLLVCRTSTHKTGTRHIATPLREHSVMSLIISACCLLFL